MLTYEDILNMPAGKEMDALVAEKVMGWRVTYHDHKNGRDSDYSWISAEDSNGNWFIIKPSKWQDDWGKWSPSTDIATAWEVWQKMLEDFPDKELPAADFVNNIMGGDYCDTLRDIVFLFKKITPESICRAALLAVFKSEQ